MSITDWAGHDFTAAVGNDPILNPPTPTTTTTTTTQRLTLPERMKGYEQQYRAYLPKTYSYLIVRIDGRALEARRQYRAKKARAK